MTRTKVNATPSRPTQNGIAIREFRRKAGVELQELADYAGVSAPHMRNIENEHRNASPEHLSLIARRLDVQTAALMRDYPEPAARAS